MLRDGRRDAESKERTITTERVIKNGKSFIGHRFGSLVVVEFKGMIDGDAHKRKSVWRANCDCDPNGRNFLYDTIRNIKLSGQCPECRKKLDKRRKLA